MTYLVVSVWKLIDETFKEIGIPIINAHDLLDSIKDDQRVWDLFKNGITCTLNQVDSDNGREQAMKYGISSFEEGAFIAAAIRPSFDPWREQFERRLPYTTGSRDLDKVLEMTGGYILYQESLMQYFDWLGVTPAESIGLIKKISKKKIKPEDFSNLEERLRQNWIAKTGSEDRFDDTWHMVQSCMAYGFAAPHAAATSLDMCYGAYLKVHYPFEYYSVCFNNYCNDEVRTRKLRDELAYFNMTLKGIKFRNSKSTYSYDKEKREIYKGMQSIKFLNATVSDELYELRNNIYEDFIDLCDDVSSQTSINTRQMKILISLDFFSEFGEINYLLHMYDVYCAMHTRKNMKKSDVENTVFSEAIIAKFAISETEKMYRFDVDSVKNMLKFYGNCCEIEPCSIRDIVNYQREYLGYIDYIDPTENQRLVVVTNLDTKFSPRFSAYCLKTGQTCELRVHKTKRSADKSVKTSFASVPFKNGDILYMNRCQKKQGKMQNQDGRWVPSGKWIWWLQDYKVIN